MKIDPPAKWSLKPIPEMENAWVWRMVQRPEDLELPRGEIPVYARQWFDRWEFECWLRERYKVKFVKEVLLKWEK